MDVEISVGALTQEERLSVISLVETHLTATDLISIQISGLPRDFLTENNHDVRVGRYGVNSFIVMITEEDAINVVTARFNEFPSLRQVT